MRVSAVTYLFRFHCPRLPPSSCPPQRSRKLGAYLAGPGLWCRLPVVPVSLTWTRMGPLRSSGDPSRAFAAFQDPGRANVSSPVSDTLMLPPLPIRRRPRRYLISGLTRSFSTRYRTLQTGVAARLQGSLPAGGLRLCREGFEPSGSLRKVSARCFDDHPPFLLS